MESFLNGRPKLPKATKLKGADELSSLALDAWSIPKPGAALPEKRSRAETHDLSTNEHQPKVQMILEDGEVRKIRIECTCGHIIELDCIYKGAGQG